jgi:hypothetical protein
VVEEWAGRGLGPRSDGEIGRCIVCGCNFPNCPRTSIYEASERDFRIVAARDALSGLANAGALELEQIGVRLWTTAEVVAAVRAPLADLAT